MRVTERKGSEKWDELHCAFAVGKPENRDNVQQRGNMLFLQCFKWIFRWIESYRLCRLMKRALCIFFFSATEKNTISRLKSRHSLRPIQTAACLLLICFTDGYLDRGHKVFGSGSSLCCLLKKPLAARLMLQTQSLNRTIQQLKRPQWFSLNLS